ncbi:ABC transporter permease [Aerococcaceae bacterium DSM 111176]|nr:ABC transporter permease [Aerococcaceae bacterium DSM 111176]
MLKHLLAYTPKLSYRNRDGFLYGILFPLAFSLIYLTVFSDMVTSTSFDAIQVAMVFEGNQEEVQIAEDSLSNIASIGEIDSSGNLYAIESHDTEPLIIYLPVENLDEGQSITEEYNLTGTVLVNNENNAFNIQMDIAPNKVNDLNTTVLHTILKSFTAISKGTQIAIQQAGPNPFVIQQITSALQEHGEPQFFSADQTTTQTSNFSIYIYAALAYVCIFFISISSQWITENEAHTSPQALRKVVSPIGKIPLFMANFITGTIPSLLVVYTVLGIYMVADMPIGQEYGRLFLLLTIGTLVGLSLGTATASLLKSRPNTLTAIGIALPLIFGATSGMMNTNLKFFINENMSWLNKINPVSLINDAIYYLNNYPTYAQFNQNILILLTMFILLMGVTFVGLRRDSYASL